MYHKTHVGGKIFCGRGEVFWGWLRLCPIDRGLRPLCSRCGDRARSRSLRRRFARQLGEWPAAEGKPRSARASYVRPKG